MDSLRLAEKQRAAAIFVFTSEADCDKIGGIFPQNTNNLLYKRKSDILIDKKEVMRC